MPEGNLREAAIEYLRRLAAGTVSPADAADWAMRLMESGAPELEDEQLRAALDQLSGADLMVEPGEYLHGKEDYQAWADQLSSSEAK